MRGGFIDRLRAVALTAAVAGAAGSVGLMLYVGRRNPSSILMLLFAIWVLSPFSALVLADRASKRWSTLTRATLYSLMLILMLGSLAIYGYVGWRQPSKPAFAFLVVPLASWLLACAALPLAALASGRLMRRGGT